MCRVLFFILMFTSGQVFAGGGFSRDHFDLTNIKAHLNVTCESPFDGQKSYANLDCETDRLEPLQSDYFYGAKNQADRLRLTVVKNNQAQLTQDFKYNGQLGRSENKIQIWKNGNPQQSILAEGSNLIDYQLMAKKRSD